MSKIELTEAQTEKLRRVWLVETTHAKALVAVANELIAMGLVRPASDPHAAHFKELWESIEGRIKAHDDLAAKVAALEALVGNSHPHEIDFPTRLATLEAWRHSMMQDKACPPDPHAAAKERATLWGVELVTLKDGTCLFMTEKHYLSNPKPSWFPHVFSFRSPHYSGGHKTPSEAWSNFPTEPPPGWEESQSKAIPPKLPEPRTDADRLGEVAWKADGGALEGDEWANDRDTSPVRRQAYRTIALAVRKADRASQLEPSEEEVAKAFEAFSWRKHGPQGTLIDALKAAARVRLEKAEGERP
jgi:hypothetical protein